ncbi:Nonribosomal peptide synthetase vlms [Lachnellula arida]|uniref:Nonribosomal peptide synthetase vlms n=1 Tax=Lachnellula arida TaxID=1316785 RepID=A0A8T9B6L6_9HELO|nr:Nonribosomal peptide synthetase vlms [Lachnellula arida]
MGEFWEKQLRGDIPTSWPDIPSGFPVHAKQVVKLSASLQTMGQSEFVGSALLRAAWAMTVGLYTTSTDIIYAEIFSGRNISLEGTAQISGPLITTVPMRVRFDKTLTVESYLAEVQRQAVDLIPYQHVGLQNITKILAGKQSLPELRHMFIIQSENEREEEVEALWLESLPFESADFDTFPMNVSCTQDGDNVEVEIKFDDRILSTDEMDRIIDQFLHLLHQLRTAPGQSRLNQLQLLSRASPSDTQIRGCIRSSTKYEVSSIVASRLAQAGVGPNVFVPLCFNKSSAIVAMLGVLKAGGACVSLDPARPVSRIKRIIEDTRATLVLSSPGQAKLFKGLVSEARIAPSFNVGQNPNDPAFVIYTSGTTGVPKGVVVPHKAICTSAFAHGERLKIGRDTRALQFAVYTFDASIQDIFTVLQRGGCVGAVSALSQTKTVQATYQEQ